MFLCLYTLSNDQIRVISISTTSNIYHFFVGEDIKSPLLAVLKNILLLTVVSLISSGTSEFVPQI